MNPIVRGVLIVLLSAAAWWLQNVKRTHSTLPSKDNSIHVGNVYSGNDVNIGGQRDAK